MTLTGSERPPGPVPRTPLSTLPTLLYRSKPASFLWTLLPPEFKFYAAL